MLLVNTKNCMKQPPSRLVHVSLLSAVFLMAMIGCATKVPAEPRTSTTPPALVDEATDNRVLLSMLVPGLVVGLNIKGEEISTVFTRIMMIPKPNPRREGSELITVTGLREGKVLATVQVSDLRLTVREGFREAEGALLIMERRTVTAALPLPARIDMLEVRLPGNREPMRQDLRETFDRHCTADRQSILC